MLNANRPSWRKDGGPISIGHGMHRSVSQISGTELALELVPERSQFGPVGAHNYTCFLPLVGGRELESNPVQIRPISKLLQSVFVRLGLIPST